MPAGTTDGAQQFLLSLVSSPPVSSPPVSSLLAAGNHELTSLHGQMSHNVRSLRTNDVIRLHSSLFRQCCLACTLTPRAGMAGSGKTTFMQRLNAHLHATQRPGYIINLDPAVTHVRQLDARTLLHAPLAAPGALRRLRASAKSSAGWPAATTHRLNAPLGCCPAPQRQAGAVRGQRGHPGHGELQERDEAV